MKVFITGVCGFVGSALAEALLELREGISVFGVDNLQRPGSEMNRGLLRPLGVQVIHGDIRAASDLESLPPADWVIDAAANPSVLAGVKGNGSSPQLFEHNLASLVNVLEYCKKHKAGLLLLSSSRVYSIAQLTSLPLKICGDAFRLDASGTLPVGVSEQGIGPGFSTAPPISLYGSTKLACEIVALEYGAAYDFPVWVNHCGVLAGAGQFWHARPRDFLLLDQRPSAATSPEIHWLDGQGRQVRDLFHPRDLASLLNAQIRTSRTGGCRVYTAGGGPDAPCPSPS